MLVHLDEFPEGPVIGGLSLFGETATGQLLHAEMIMKALAAQASFGTIIGAGTSGEIGRLILAVFHRVIHPLGNEK